MKLFFSILWVSTVFTFSSPVLITYEQHHEKALLIKKILTEKIGIPAGLIDIEFSRNECWRNDQSSIQICVDNNGQMKLVKSQKDILKAFQFFTREN